jgi:hypothetical protein
MFERGEADNKGLELFGERGIIVFFVIILICASARECGGTGARPCDWTPDAGRAVVGEGREACGDFALRFDNVVHDDTYGAEHVQLNYGSP